MKDLLKNIFDATKSTRPNKLHKSIFFGLAFMLIVTISMSDTMRITQENFEQLLSAVLPSAIVQLTNEERAGETLSTLTRSPILDHAALLKAEHMRDTGYFAHFSPTGVSPWYWFDVAGYDYIHAGENLAVFFDDSEDVVQAWMDSPLHRDNILKAEYTEIGVATVEAEYKDYKTVFIVQLFGTPANKVPVQNTVAVAPQKVIEEVTTTPVQKPTAVAVKEVRGIEETPIEQSPEEEEEEAVSVPLEPEPLENVSTPSSISTPSEVVTSVPLSGKNVFISDHISTTTIPAYTNPTENILQTSSRTTGGLKEILYLLTLLFVIVVLFVSVLLARTQHNFVHAFYSIGLLILTIITVMIHANIVSASTLF